MSSRIAWMEPSSIRATSLAFALFVSQSLHSADKAVEIDAEPMHLIRMNNAFIRVYDAIISGGAKTLMHTHRYSGMGIDMTAAELRLEKVGAEPVEIRTIAGDVFPVKVAIPYDHIVNNIGERSYRAVMAEQLAATNLSPIRLEQVPGYKIEVETDTAIAYRLILRPGESTGEHVLRTKSLVVSVSGGQISVTMQGKPSTMQAIAPGDLEWVAETGSVLFLNSGVTDYSAVVMEWK